MKAILILEVNDKAIDDIELVNLSYRMKGKGGNITYFLGGENIKLKPLPQKIDANDWHRMFSGSYKEREAKGYGYNACLDEILGDNE